MPDTQLQIKEHKKSAHPPSCVKFCALTQDIMVLSPTIALHYYNLYTEDNTSPENYGYPFMY
jgi:hypothetical protein